MASRITATSVRVLEPPSAAGTPFSTAEVSISNSIAADLSRSRKDCRARPDTITGDFLNRSVPRVLSWPRISRAHSKHSSHRRVSFAWHPVPDCVSTIGSGPACRKISLAPSQCLARLHQLRGLSGAKPLKSLGHHIKSRHYRGERSRDFLDVSSHDFRRRLSRQFELQLSKQER